MGDDMNPDDLARILDDLGERLGPAGEYVFGLAIRYKVTDAIVGILFALVILTVSAVLVRRAFRHDFRDDMDRDIVRMAASLIGGLLGLIALVFLAINVVTLLNPEYAAIRDILGAIR